MPIKKSVLYRSIWQACDELRGGMDASQYKDYILVLLFVKYVSDRYAGKPDALLEVPEGARYADLLALKGQKEIGDKMNKIIRALAEATDLVGVITIADFNNPDKLGRDKEMVDRLSKLVAIFDRPDLDFSEQNPAGDDILGDAYEYLMRHFAQESGKSKGQFYTPGEVSRVIAQVIGVGQATKSTQTIYDPTCGSGSLLLRAYDEARSRTGLELTLYGQEKDNATVAMARMNVIVHHAPTAELWHGNTLAHPYFKTEAGQVKTFDFVVANPPFSDKGWTSGVDLQHDTRFAYGKPPEKNGDYAFLLHVLASLKSTGKGAIILPHGVLFRGGAEADIRKNLVQRGFIKGIIGLPAKLFYGTDIPACILLLDKEHAVARKGIFMIDASKGFMKDGNKNRLRERDIHRIVDAYTRQLELPRYSRLVPVAEVEQNGFNLNLPRYIDTTDPEDLQDLEGHLRGGIPERDVEALGAWWSVLPGLREELFEALRPGYVRLRVEPKRIKTTIFGHPVFTAFQTRVRTHFGQWKDENKATLENIGSGQRPRLLIESLSAPLLAAFAPLPLIDPYAIYQHLMDYWAEQLQDDAWMLIQAGWKAKDEAGKPNRDLIPPELIIRRYFAKEQAALEALETARDAHTLALQELEEEHGGEEGLLVEAKNDKGKLTRVSVKARLAVVGEAEPAAPTEGTQIVLTWDGADPYHHALLDFFVSNQHQGASPSVGELLEREYFGDWTAAEFPAYVGALRDAGNPISITGRGKSARVSWSGQTWDLDDHFAVSLWRALVVSGEPILPVADVLQCLEDDRWMIEEVEHYAKAFAAASGPIDFVAGKVVLKPSEATADDESSTEADERTVLMRYVDLMDQEAAAGKQIKDAQKALDAQVEAKYGALVEAGIRTLVVEDKWLAAVAGGVQAELDRTSRALTDRIRVLAERYARPLPELVGEVEGLSEKVSGHLRKMGAVWS